VVSQAVAATVINGGFETGTFSGWTVVNQAGGNGSWYVYSNASSLPPGLCSSFFAPPAPPPEGTYAATTDMSAPGSHVLYQDVALEPNAKHTLSFILYYQSRAAFVSPSPPSLDYTVLPNQQYRVDVMKPSADPFSVAASDVLETLFQTTPSSPVTLSPTTMTFDLSRFAGQTVRLRFAAVETQQCLLASVDDVRVASTAGAKTRAATDVTDTSATLHGTVDPNGQATTYHFEYGTSTSYGRRVPALDVSVGSDLTSHAVSQSISGLEPNTTYHFRIVATNASGTTDGADMTFKTSRAVCQDPKAAFDEGFNAAWNNAWNHGFNPGFNHGFNAGFDAGFHRGFGRSGDVSVTGTRAFARAALAAVCDPDFNHGFDAGWHSGFNHGFNHGFDIGFNSGFNIGFNSGFTARHHR
jgi:hypothetical protein